MKRWSLWLIFFAVGYGMSLLAIILYVEAGETGKAFWGVIGGIFNAAAYFAELWRIDRRNWEAKVARMKQARLKDSQQ